MVSEWHGEVQSSANDAKKSRKMFSGLACNDIRWRPVCFVVCVVGLFVWLG